MRSVVNYVHRKEKWSMSKNKNSKKSKFGWLSVCELREICQFSYQTQLEIGCRNQKLHFRLIFGGFFQPFEKWVSLFVIFFLCCSQTTKNIAEKLFFFFFFFYPFTLFFFFFSSTLGKFINVIITAWDEHLFEKLSFVKKRILFPCRAAATYEGQSDSGNLCFFHGIFSCAFKIKLDFPLRICSHSILSSCAQIYLNLSKS